MYIIEKSLLLLYLTCKMKTTEFHRLVRAHGWEVLRQTGSHVIYRKGTRIYPVPYHGSKEIGFGLEMKMRKEMGLKLGI